MRYGPEHQISKGTAWQLTVPYVDFAGEQRTVVKLQVVCHDEGGEGSWLIDRVDQEPTDSRPMAVQQQPGMGPIRRFLYLGPFSDQQAARSGG